MTAVTGSQQSPNGATDLLARVTSRVQRAFDRCAYECDLPVVQARLLLALEHDAPTIGELAQRLALDKSSASGLIDRAERGGLVRRVPSQLDRRSVRVRLTDRGRECARDVEALFNAELTALLGPLSNDQLAALSVLLSAVLQP